MKFLVGSLALTSVVLGAVWLSASSAPQEAVTVDHTFRGALIHSKGVKTMEELRGKPVIVDFWGKN